MADIISLPFTLIFILVGILYWYHKRVYSYWNIRNVKSLPTLPLIGSNLKNIIMKDNTATILRNIYNENYNEKLVGGFKGTCPELIINDPDIIRSILVKDFTYFHDREEGLNENEMTNQHLFHLTGERWRILRQKLTPTFTSAKMKKMYHLITECTEELGKYLDEQFKNNDEIEVKATMAKFTMNSIGACAFGLNMESLSDENSIFTKMGNLSFKPDRKRETIRVLHSMMPNLLTFFNVKARSDTLEKFFMGIVEQLKTSRKDGSNRHDFMDLLLELKKNGQIAVDKNDKIIAMNENDKDYIEFTDKLIAAQAYVFFVAGFETSASTMSYALRELALNPDIQKKLQEEIDRVLEKNGGILSYDAIQEMKYLDMVIDETLRKYPPLGFLMRTCKSQYIIPNTNVELDKGVKIVIPVYALQNDPRYHTEPEKFLPERFSSENIKNIRPFTYMPFGEGPRNCIGLRFGKLQAAAGLASVLRKFTLEPCSRTNYKLEFNPLVQVAACKGGIWLKVKLRG